MFSRLISIPFILMALISLFLAWEVHRSYSIYIVPPVLILALIFVLSPQINWWWYSRRPPDLKPVLRALLERAPGFYHRLGPDDQLKFRQRMALFVMAHEFMPEGIEAVPPDAEAVVAASAITVTFGQEDFLFKKKYERIIFYVHPFPTPQYPELFHTSEVFDEDGVLLFSLEHLFRGFMQPQQYFHLGLYEYAKVFMRTWPSARFPQVEEAYWPVLERISGFSRKAIEEWVGLPDISPVAVAAAHFFIFPEAFKQEWPEAFEQFGTAFGNPAR